MTYEYINVWRRMGPDTVRVYRCFRVLQTGRYCVQSADMIGVPIDREWMDQLERQFYELLVEQAPDERSGTYDSLDAAITAFDREFDDAGGA